MTPRKDKIERNTALIQRYVDGEKIEDLCESYQLTRSRVFQILKEAGVLKERYGTKGRDQFLGINLSEEVKEALKAEAQRRKISMSAISAEYLRSMLVYLGYPLEAEKVVDQP